MIFEKYFSVISIWEFLYTRIASENRHRNAVFLKKIEQTFCGIHVESKKTTYYMYKKKKNYLLHENLSLS